MLQESYIYDTIYTQRNVEKSYVIFAPYSYCYYIQIYCT